MIEDRLTLAILAAPAIALAAMFLLLASSKVASKYQYNSSTMLISATLEALLAPLQSECVFGFDQILCHYNSTEQERDLKKCSTNPSKHFPKLAALECLALKFDIRSGRLKMYRTTQSTAFPETYQ